jgi:hypothetical protein
MRSSAPDLATGNLVHPPFHHGTMQVKIASFQVSLLANIDDRKTIFSPTSAALPTVIFPSANAVNDSIFERLIAQRVGQSLFRDGKRRGFQTFPDKFTANAEAREIGARWCISDEILHGSWLPNLFI